MMIARFLVLLYSHTKNHKYIDKKKCTLYTVFTEQKPLAVLEEPVPVSGSDFFVFNT